MTRRIVQLVPDGPEGPMWALAEDGTAHWYNLGQKVWEEIAGLPDAHPAEGWEGRTGAAGLVTVELATVELLTTILSQVRKARDVLVVTGLAARESAVALLNEILDGHATDGTETRPLETNFRLAKTLTDARYIIEMIVAADERGQGLPFTEAMTEAHAFLAKEV